MVRGVDGCKAGWLAVSLSSDGSLSSAVFQDAVAVLRDDRYAVTAIDIPIGLPEVGPRSCDIEARKLLGPRRSSVFPAPMRSLLAAQTYEAACSMSRLVCGRMLSQQSFAILPKIREIDLYLQENPAAISRVREIHPEVCFFFWNRGQPMQFSKLSGFGFVERLKLIEGRFPGAPARVRRDHPAKSVSDDDILDALAALWSALRLSANTAVRVGTEGEQDARGLSIGIWA
jgi:predicted RNase H-like nuclease